jgi:hypothetical protein
MTPANMLQHQQVIHRACVFAHTRAQNAAGYYTWQKTLGNITTERRFIGKD